MKVSGFTFVRDAIRFGYPVFESIASVLPLCDEFIIVVGNSQDETLSLIHSINSPKIRIIETVWDETLKEKWRIFAQQTNIALSHCRYEWCFYIQADEVLHEKFYPRVMKAMEDNLEDHRVQGLLFDYIHFYGSYWTIAKGRKWYRREIRIVRNHIGVESYKDAQGFRIGRKKLLVKHIGAQVYHYGWARPPHIMIEKQRNLDRFWHTDFEIEKKYSKNTGIFSEQEYVEIFKDTHPACMAQKIANSPSVDNLQVKKKGFLYFIKNLPIFEYRNYKLI
ncbi:TPA: glycosyl transferase [bacterium]|nr:glycosyl transferase [bacterium]